MSIDVPGIYDIPISHYVADPVVQGSLSASELSTILSCPAKLGHGGSTPAQNFGSAVHALVLEGEAAFREGWHVQRQDARTKAGKLERSEAQEAGLAIMSSADYEAATAMSRAAHAHTIAGPLLRSGEPEKTLIWQDSATGLWLRSRPDILPAGNATIDFKAVADASPHAIQRDAWKYGWARQAALMADGMEALRGARPEYCALVCQEKSEPYAVTVTMLDAEALDVAGRQNRRAMERYLRLREIPRHQWPAYSDDVVTITVPAWLAQEKKETSDE